MPGQTTCRALGAERAQGTPGTGQASERPRPPDRICGELDEFTSIVSHDLKEPLAGIRGYSEILLEDYQDKLDSDGQRRLNALVQMCDRLAASIDSLLRFSRVGRIECPEAEVDLNAVVEEVLQTFRPTIDARRGSVEVAGRLPMVKGDAVLIGEVLGNLFANGLKFNRSDKPRVEIGSVAGEMPTIYVRDNGIGIPREHHQAIFTIFRRLHHRREFEGTGAGLTIVRKIVESHGGRIWLESEPGRGATFFFTLHPATSDAPPAKPPTQPPHWGRSLGRRSSRGAGRR